MAKLQLPLVGAEINTKEFLILLGGIGILFWLVKRGITKKVDKVVESVKPVFNAPGEMIYDLFHPVEDPEIDLYTFSIRDQIAVNKQILEAQSGGYTHRADSQH